MSDGIKNILSSDGKKIDQQQVLDYLENKLAGADAHELEKALSEDAFLQDAMEGLQQVKDHQEIPRYVDQLNHRLKKQLDKRKKRRFRQRLREQPYIYFALLLVLLLMVCCFLLVRYYSMAAR